MNLLKKIAKVSVVIPTYNRYNELKKKLDFFLNIKNSNFEVVIIDDGSTDGTKYLVIDFKKKAKFQIKYLYQDNQGLSKSLQRGIMNSSGYYIIFQGSDDLFITDVFNEFMMGNYDSVLSSDKTAGIVFRCKDHNGNSISPACNVEQLNKYSYQQFNKNNRGDKKIFIKNNIYKKIIKKYLNFNNHVPNSVYFMDIDQEYDFYFSNSIIGIKSYLEGGITKNYFSHIRKNPNGWLILSSKIINLKYKFSIHFFILKVKQYINFSKYLIFSLTVNARISHLDKISFLSCLLIVLFSPFGLILFAYDKLKNIFKIESK